MKQVSWIEKTPKKSVENKDGISVLEISIEKLDFVDGTRPESMDSSFENFCFLDVLFLIFKYLKKVPECNTLAEVSTV